MRVPKLGASGVPGNNWLPATGDRIRCARQAQKEGVFGYDAPASTLIENFDVISKQVTMLHYSEDLGLEPAFVNLRPSASFFETSKAAEVPEPENEAKVLMEKQHGPPRLKLKAGS